MDKTSHRNPASTSLKLTETLSELEAALQAWDRGDHDAEAPTATKAADSAPLSENDPRKRAQDLLRQLREQIAQLDS